MSVFEGKADTALTCYHVRLRPFDGSKLQHSILGGLHRPSPDDFPCRLRLKYCWFLCERIDAAPLLCCRLFDNNEFGESGHKKDSRSFELLVANRGERLDDGFDVLPRHIVRMLGSNF